MDRLSEKINRFVIQVLLLRWVMDGDVMREGGETLGRGSGSKDGVGGLRVALRKITNDLKHLVMVGKGHLSLYIFFTFNESKNSRTLMTNK